MKETKALPPIQHYAIERYVPESLEDMLSFGPRRRSKWLPVGYGFGEDQANAILERFRAAHPEHTHRVRPCGKRKKRIIVYEIVPK